MKYHIISAPYTDTLEREVQKLIAKGWKPLGGPSVTSCTPGIFHIIQAMVKDDK